jgi:hypothetical protein
MDLSSHPSYNSLIGTLGASVVFLIGALAAVWRLWQIKHRTMLAKAQLAHQRIQRQDALELELAQREILTMRREIDLLSRKLQEQTDADRPMPPALPGPAMRSKRRPDSFIVVDDVLGLAADRNHGFADTAILPEDRPT